jgi:hypothetical protein
MARIAKSQSVSKSRGSKLRRLLADLHLILMRLAVIAGLHQLVSHGPRSIARP